MKTRKNSFLKITPFLMVLFSMCLVEMPALSASRGTGRAAPIASAPRNSTTTAAVSESVVETPVETIVEAIEEEPEEIIIEPSRKVSIKTGEYLDIEYPGKGWVYLGAVDLSKNLNYFGRKLSTENTKYTFISNRNYGIIDEKTRKKCNGGVQCHKKSRDKY